MAEWYRYNRDPAHICYLCRSNQRSKDSDIFCGARMKIRDSPHCCHLRRIVSHCIVRPLIFPNITSLPATLSTSGERQPWKPSGPAKSRPRTCTPARSHSSTTSGTGTTRTATGRVAAANNNSGAVSKTTLNKEEVGTGNRVGNKFHFVRHGEYLSFPVNMSKSGAVEDCWARP